MDYSKETFPLNHFVLWCKGWYRPTNDKATLEETLRIVFALDGYPFAKKMGDFLNIILTEFEPYYKWVREHNNGICFNMQMLCKNAIDYETYNETHGHSVSFAECMFYAIAGFFRYRGKDIRLEKPIYSRELRTKGLCFRQAYRGNYHGMTYAEQNRIASKAFDK